MNVREFQRILARRWQLILGATILGLVVAFLYSARQHQVFQASATVFAHPSSVLSKPTDINADTGLLTYGTLAQTFASLAESRSMLSAAGADAKIPAATVDQYSVNASALPQTTVLEVSVQGPDATLATRLANALVSKVSSDTGKYFRTITLTPLDSASVPSDTISAKPTRDMLYGAIVGFLVGFILAALSVYKPVPVSSAVPNRAANYTEMAPVVHSRNDQGIPAR